MDISQVKHIRQKDKDLTFGYIRDAQSLLPNEDNSYYNIPEIVGFLTVLYFYLSEYFEFAANSLQLLDDKKMIKWNGNETGIVGAAYGNIRINNSTSWKKCAWKFKIDIADFQSIIEIGLVSADYENGGAKFMAEAASFYVFECGDYDGEYNNIEMIGKNSESKCKDESIAHKDIPGLKNGDVIMMDLDLEEKTLRVFVNEVKHNLYFQIEMNNGVEYKMVVDIDDPASVTIIDFEAC